MRPRRLGFVPLLLASVAVPALAVDVLGRFDVAGEGAARLELTGAPGALVVTRTPGGGEPLRADATLSDTGWIEAPFGGGLTSGVQGGGSDAGFGLWQVLGDGAIYGFFTDSAGVRRYEAGGRAGTGVRHVSGFRQHLREAIALNTARRPVYEALSGGASRRVSKRLVLVERATSLWAAWIDFRARRWQKKGVQIVAGDFASMEHVRPASSPPRWRGRMSKAQQEQLEGRLDVLRRETKRLLEARRWVEAARLADAELAAVEGLEAAWGCHLAMTKHTIEQVGFAALNADTWSRQSGGETDGLARHFVWALRVGIWGGPAIDAMAQEGQAAGAAVVVNDVPEIPLRRALRGAR